MLVLPIYLFGFALSAAQALFGWVLSSRTPNEPAPTAGEERPWNYHEVIGVLSWFSTLSCMPWILLLFLFCRSKRYLRFIGAGWHANATLVLAGPRLFFHAHSVSQINTLSNLKFSTVIVALLLVFHSAKSPKFSALLSSCTAVGFRAAHACAPLGVLAFLPITIAEDFLSAPRW
ncbi:hypothetical protein B0H16DRAFT_1787156 [Mycena metata]|uniref:Uncharacterized protein n=1 Tax=Mycena metata TaxID=1033252 RepID=A0AAD7JPY8_9AGAR|nr:hypothetical protein B0H16DRAFT_1787156 [Mycena metata]